MWPSADRPVLEEPWAKRLRMTRSRSFKAGLEQSHSDRLPSPKPTNPSSTDDIPSSSSTGHKANSKQKQVRSLRERLVPLPKKPGAISSVSGTQAATKKPASKPSVAPFFQRIEAAFQDKPATITKTHPAITPVPRPARSPSPDAEDLIQQLKEHYLLTATTLHQQAHMRLAQTHADLARKLSHTLAQENDAFLAQTEFKIKKLAQPLDKFRIRSQQRDALSGEMRSEENSVGELVARAEEQLEEFEREVGGLWREWAEAEGEVKALLGGVVSSMGTQLGGGGDGEGCDREGEEMLERLRKLIEREIGEAEEEVAEFGEEAVGLMKEIEKDFRKTTLPDLHTFFQSIDEP